MAADELLASPASVDRVGQTIGVNFWPVGQAPFKAFRLPQKLA
jgi:hypothetical protein